MSLRDIAPGKSVRIQMTSADGRCSTVWSAFSAKRTADMYVSPRMMGGGVKLSLHESGSWHVGLTKEAPADILAEGSRHWEIWKRGGEFADGIVRAWYLLIPDRELRLGHVDAKAHRLPPVGEAHAVSLEFLLVANEGPMIEIENVHLVGRFPLTGRNESCLIAARRIAWPSGLCDWADAARRQAIAQAEAAGIVTQDEHRLFLHGHDEQGVRFGLELASMPKGAS